MRCCRPVAGAWLVACVHAQQFIDEMIAAIQGGHHRPLARAIPRRRRVADRRRAVRGGQGAHARGAVPAVQRARRCRKAGGAHERPAAGRDPGSRGSAARRDSRAGSSSPCRRPTARCARSCSRDSSPLPAAASGRAAPRAARPAARAERARHRRVREPAARAAAKAAGAPLDAALVRRETRRGHFRTPACRSCRSRATARDPAFMDAEKIVWDWPDVGARVIEEFR